MIKLDQNITSYKNVLANINSKTSIFKIISIYLKNSLHIIGSPRCKDLYLNNKKNK